MNTTKQVDQTTPESGLCKSLKKRIHITYFLKKTPNPVLSGETIYANNIIQGICLFIDKTDVNIHDIKYAIEL